MVASSIIGWLLPGGKKEKKLLAHYLKTLETCRIEKTAMFKRDYVRTWTKIKRKRRIEKKDGCRLKKDMGKKSIGKEAEGKGALKLASMLLVGSIGSIRSRPKPMRECRQSANGRYTSRILFFYFSAPTVINEVSKYIWIGK